MMAEIYLVDHEDKQLQRVGMSDNDEGILEILQYLIDGMGEDQFDNGVAVRHPVSGFYMTGKSLARMRKKYGLRKRTFDEKIAGFETWRDGLMKAREQ